MHRNSDDNRLLAHKQLNDLIPNKFDKIGICINELRECIMCYMEVKQNVLHLLFQ